MKLSNSYQNRRVLITGHTGFKGRWLAAWLDRLGAQVIGLSLPSPGRPTVPSTPDSWFGDIRDPAFVRDAVAKSAPDIVFHLAAQALVRRSYQDPVGTFASNVMGTVNVLEAVRHAASVRAVVVVTSDKCYENHEWCWGYREADQLGGRDPYSNSKACAEFVTASYRHSFLHGTGPAVGTVRAGNVIGGGDWSEDRIIPDIVRALRTGQPVRVRRPGAVRPWQHVLEPLWGYLLLGERLWTDGQAFAEAWNFGPRDACPLTVQELVERFLALWGEGQMLIEDGTPGPAEAQYLKLDCSKAAARLGWLPRLSIDEALRLTVDWYRTEWRDSNAATELLRRQIKSYEAMPGPASATRRAA